MATAILRHGRTDQGRLGNRQWWVETPDGYVISGGHTALFEARSAARTKGLRVSSVRGRLIYDERFGHVCTCTEHPVGAEGDQDGHWTIYEYENTVTADRGSATESGSYWYSC